MQRVEPCSGLKGIVIISLIIFSFSFKFTVLLNGTLGIINTIDNNCTVVIITVNSIVKGKDKKNLPVIY